DGMNFQKTKAAKPSLVSKKVKPTKFVKSGIKSTKEELNSKSRLNQLKALKKSGKHDGKIFINIDSDAETIELHGPHEGTKVAGGHLLVKKNGKVLLDEQFEGKMPERLKKQLEEIKNEDDEGDLDIQIKLTGPSEGHRKAHKVIRKKVEAAGDESAVFEIKVDGKGAKNQQIWISKDGEEMKLDGDEKHFIFNVDVMEEGDGTKEIAKSVFVFHVLHIEDIKEEDEDIPAEFRFGDQPKLDESISELSFYPNPNDGQFKLNFNLKDKGNTEISIFDLNGKEIYREQLNDFTGSYSKDVNLQSQPKGLYILKISQGDKVMSKKLVLQ
ncbi:MAG: T9SS type A sorting domain-containing protein, partial [Flammeovirgaceae bacterium]